MAGARREPLAVLELVVGAIFALMVVVCGAVGVGMLAGQASVPGVNAEVCVSTVPGSTVGFREDGDPSVGPVGLTDGITWRTESIQICEPDPSGATAVLGVVGLLVWAGAPLVFFGLLWRLIRSARRDGAFAATIPGGLRTLGRFLLAWAALDVVVSGIVNGALLTRMTDHVVFFASDDLPWLLVLLGIAFLALHRIIGEAVVLREDSEATI